MTLALNITVSSFRKTVENWLEQSLKADVYISVPRLVSNQANEVIPQDLQDLIDTDFKDENLCPETLSIASLLIVSWSSNLEFKK